MSAEAIIIQAGQGKALSRCHWAPTSSKYGQSIHRATWMQHRHGSPGLLMPHRIRPLPGPRHTLLKIQTPADFPAIAALSVSPRCKLSKLRVSGRSAVRLEKKETFD